MYLDHYKIPILMEKITLIRVNIINTHIVIPIIG